MKIALMTGGGDVPGLNACIKTVVQRVAEEGHQAIGVLRGWGGLLHYNLDDPRSHKKNVVKLTESFIRTIDRNGGTILHSSRVHPGRVPFPQIPDFLQSSETQDAQRTYDFTPHVLAVLASLEVDVLIAIGGDDTLGYGARIHQEGFPVICIPKTMDNDVTGTEYCIGFSSAVTESVRAIQRLRTTTASHERIGVIELFGRNSGETSLVSAYLGNADRAIISEVPFDIEKLARLLMKDKAKNPSSYAMMTISEGALEIGGEIVQTEKSWIDPYGHKKLGGIGAMVAARLERLTGEKTVPVQLSFLMRAGPPDTLDKMVAMNFANTAVDLIHEKQFGRMVALCEGRYTHVSASLPSVGPRKVDVDALYDSSNYRPKIGRTIGMPMFLR